MRTVTTILLTILAAAGASPAQTITPQTLELARSNIRNAVGRTDTSANMFRGLCSTEDKALLPVLERLCVSGDRPMRLAAVAAVGQIGGASAAQRMRAVFQRDSDTGVRALALAHLIEHEAVGEEELRLALASGDDTLMLLAGRWAVKKGNARQAIDALSPLLQRPDPSVTPLVRTVLLAAGDAQQAQPLEEALLSDQTPDRAKLAVLDMVHSEVVRPAEPAVRKLLDVAPLTSMRLGALRALAAINAEQGAQAILQRLAQSDDMVVRVQLMALLAELPAPGEYLTRLKQSGPPLVAAMASFELAVAEGKDQDLAVAAGELLATRQPVVVEFVLRRAVEKPSPVLVPALLEYIASVDPRVRRAAAEHDLAAVATRVLVQLSTPQAVEGLAKLLAEPYSAVTRSVAAGLLVADGPALPELCMRIIDSPYDELATDAAIAMGRAGDARAAGHLQQIVTHPDRYPPSLVAIASWYLLKLSGQADAVVVELAKE